MLALQAGNYAVNIGSASFLNCVYATACTYVPNDDVPNALSLLKNGTLDHSLAIKAAREMNIIRDVLSMHKPEEVVWDKKNPNIAPPWGNNISPTITSLGNYFITADGKDLISELVALLQLSSDEKASVKM